MSHDLVLRGGTILDGGGGPGFVGDVAVRDGRICQLGKLTSTQARRVLDVDGAVVAPGFIDLHSHADFKIFSAPDAITQTTQGVTTLVTGNCGMSPFPVADEHAAELRERAFLDEGLTWEWSTVGEYADAVDRLPLGVNLALQVGHGSLRTAAMGSNDRAPTPVELERMRTLVRQAAADGAVGVSSGLIYPPGRFADVDELTALVSEAAAAGLLYSTHIRDEGDLLLQAVHEALEVARRAGARLEISHLKAAGVKNWGGTQAAIEAIEAAQAEGVDVCADQYPYTASSTSLTSWLPGWALDGGTSALVSRLDDPDDARRIAAEIPHVNRTLHPDRIVVAYTPEGPYQRFVGCSVSQISTELGLEPADGIVELLRGQRAHVQIIHHGMSEDEVRDVMRHESVSVASDGSAVACPGLGQAHPRSLGTFVRVLGRYVREAGVLELPEAVRKMTSLPASRLGWSDRGTLREGAVADVAVFDPETVADKATFSQPWQLANGVVHTLLGGQTVLESGVPTEAGSGRVLR